MSNADSNMTNAQTVVPASIPAPIVKPHSIMIYAKSKWGKTLQFVRAFRKVAFIATEYGALKPASNGRLNPWRTTDGRVAVPDVFDCLSTDQPYDELMRTLDTKILPGIKDGRYTAFVLDSLTDWGDRVFIDLQKKVPAKGQKFGALYKEHVYPQIKNVIRSLLDWQHEHGIWLGVTSHLSEPSSFEGPDGVVRNKLGGPKLPGTLIEDAPYFFDIVLRGDVEKINGKPERVFRCDLDRDWITGDRSGVIGELEVADLRSILNRIVASQRGEEVEVPKVETATTL